MKRLSLIATLLLAVLLLQECKKDTYTAEANSTYFLLAVINDTTWTTDTTIASINYSAALKGKIFSFSGTANNKKIMFSAFQPAATGTTGFPLDTYNVNDSTGTISTKNSASFLLGGNNSMGVYTYFQQGIVYPGSGTMTVTAIDSVKKIITGTFQFTTAHAYYSADGTTIDSTKHNQVLQGGFNNLPYTTASN